MTPEGYVKKAVEDLLKAEHIPYWRMQSGRVFRGRGNNIKLNATGTADFLAAPNIPSAYWEGHVLMGKTLPAVATQPIKSPIPEFLWIETKSANGKITDAQLKFADFVRERGHQWLLVSDVKTLREWLRENRAR